MKTMKNIIIVTLLLSGFAGIANAQTYCMPAPPVKCEGGRIDKGNYKADIKCELINGQCVLSGISYDGPSHAIGGTNYHTVNFWLGVIVGEAVAFCARGGQ